MCVAALWLFEGFFFRAWCERGGLRVLGGVYMGFVLGVCGFPLSGCGRQLLMRLRPVVRSSMISGSSSVGSLVVWFRSFEGVEVLLFE